MQFVLKKNAKILFLFRILYLGNSLMWVLGNEALVPAYSYNYVCSCFVTYKMKPLVNANDKMKALLLKHLKIYYYIFFQ